MLPARRPVPATTAILPAPRAPAAASPAGPATDPGVSAAAAPARTNGHAAAVAAAAALRDQGKPSWQRDDHGQLGQV